MTNEDLRIIGKALSETMAKAASSAPPSVEIVPGANLTAIMAMAGDVAQFVVDTPFGSAVRVTVSKVGFGG